MTTIGGNVATIALEGKFDDCQVLVKEAFADPDLARLNLSSANSINIGRLLPQSVYYVFAAARLFYLWNTPPIGLIMIAYGAAANVPCIIVQRYNRNRIRRVLRQRAERVCVDMETAS